MYRHGEGIKKIYCVYFVDPKAYTFNALICPEPKRSAGKERQTGLIAHKLQKALFTAWLSHPAEVSVMCRF